MKRKSFKREIVEIPQNLKEVAVFIADIGKEQRIINDLKKEFNEKVEKIKSQYISEVETRQKIISEKFEGLFIFAQKNREELTKKEKKKTIELPTGIFGWRLTPPSVSIKNVKDVLNELIKRRLEKFIRVKKEVDKEAILKEPELVNSIKGISIIQYEEFFVKPLELEIEIKSDVDKLKKILK